MNLEQMELDTRSGLEKALRTLTDDAISDACHIMAESSAASPEARNRHEAYGIVAARIPKILSFVKALRKSASEMLSTLNMPNLPATESLEDLVSRAEDGAAVMLETAAAYRNALRDLYQNEEVAIDSEHDADGFELASALADTASN